MLRRRFHFKLSGRMVRLVGAGNGGVNQFDARAGDRFRRALRPREHYKRSPAGMRAETHGRRNHSSRPRVLALAFCRAFHFAFPKSNHYGAAQVSAPTQMGAEVGWGLPPEGSSEMASAAVASISASSPPTTTLS